MRNSDFELFTIVWAITVTLSMMAKAEQTLGCTHGVSKLVEFVAAKTDYGASNECPEILQSEASELSSLFAEVALHQSDVLAAFVPQTKEILLGPEVDLDTILGRSYLIHELVHAAQFASGGQARNGCSGLRESEAYLVQADYLRRNGLSEDALRFELIGLLQSSCAHPYYR